MMNLTLKRFYQAVDLAHPEKVTYYLVLVTDAGKEVLLPVQKETTEALVEMLYAQEAAVQKPLTFQEEVGHEYETDEELREAEYGGGEVEDEDLSADEESYGMHDPGEGDDLDVMESGTQLIAVSPKRDGFYTPVQSNARVVPSSEDEVPSL